MRCQSFEITCLEYVWTGYAYGLHRHDILIREQTRNHFAYLNPVDDSAMYSQVNPLDFVQPRSRSFHHWAIVPSSWWCVLTTNTCQLLLDRRLLCRRWHLLSFWPLGFPPSSNHKWWLWNTPHHGSSSFPNVAMISLRILLSPPRKASKKGIPHGFPGLCKPVPKHRTIYLSFLRNELPETSSGVQSLAHSLWGWKLEKRSMRRISSLWMVES